jgi:hypothetical protein
MAINIARRKVIAALGGTAVARPRAWLLAARARQPERMRRICVLMPFSADDQEAQAGLRHSCRDFSNWAGPTAATCGSSIAGAPTMPSAIAKMRPN